MIHQITHNDFSIDVDAIDSVAAANGFDYKRNDAGDPTTNSLDYTVRVVCRSYTKKSDEDIKLYEGYISKNALVNFSFGAVRDANYCDLLYSYNHSDATILKFLREDAEFADYNMYFWGASWLEENSAYAVAMMNRVGPTTKNTSKMGYYRAPVEKHYIAGKTYYHKVPYQFPTDSSAPSPDLGEGIRSLDTDVEYERADVIAGDTVKDGILEFKEYPGVQVSKTTQCANCGISDACQYGGRRVFGDTVLQRFTEEVCPEFSVRSLTDYIRIFGYYHTLSLVCKRVTTYYVKKLAANYPFNYEIRGTVHFAGVKDELPVAAITNEIVLLSDRIYQYSPTTDSTPVAGKKYYVKSGDKFVDAGNITQFASGVVYYTRASSGLDGDGRSLVGNHYYQYYKGFGDASEVWHDITGSAGEINASLIENPDQEYDVTLAEPVYVSKTNHITVRPPLALYDLAYDEFYPMVYVNGVKLDDSLVQIVGDVQYDIDGMLEQHWTYSPMFGDTNLWDTDQRRLLIKLGVELKAEQINPETGKVVSSGDYVTIEILPRPKTDIVYKYTQVSSDTPEEGVEYFTGNAVDGYESAGELEEFDPNTTYFTREVDEDETEQVISSASTVFDLDEYEDGIVDEVMQRAFEPLGSGDKVREGIRLLGSELVYLNGKQLVPGIDYVAFSDYNRGVSISTDTEPNPGKNYYIMKNGEYIPFSGSEFESDVTYYEGDTSKDELDTVLQNVQGPLRGLVPGGVVVVAEDDLLGIAGDEPRLLRGEGGAHAGHGVVEARLVQSHHVDVALHQQHAAPLGVLGTMDAVEDAPLGEHQGLRSVEILGLLPVGQGPAGKAQHLPPHIQHGEHEPVPELVVGSPRLFAPGGQPGADELLPAEALLRHGLQEAVPAVRRAAQAEIHGGLPADLPFLQIGRRLLPRGLAELGMEPAGRLLVELQHPLAQPGQLLILPVLRHGHARPVRQELHRLGKAEILDLHDEVHYAAALAAAEAVVDLLVRRHGEGRGLFIMEGAESE